MFLILEVETSVIYRNKMFNFLFQSRQRAVILRRTEEFLCTWKCESNQATEQQMRFSLVSFATRMRHCSILVQRESRQYFTDFWLVSTNSSIHRDTTPSSSNKQKHDNFIFQNNLWLEPFISTFNLSIFSCIILNL